MSKKKSDSELVSNRKAGHNFEFLEKFEAGIVLLGTEIKSLRNHGGTLQDAYVIHRKGELWLMNASIAPYSFGNVFNHEEKRERKLLMHKNEIEKLKKAVKEKGLTLMPLAIYLKKGRAKVSIAIAKGKKQHDKRADAKQRDWTREKQRLLRG